MAVGIIILFVGVTIVPAIAQNTEKSQSISRGNWLYVGGSGPGNYSVIQDAVDNASDGDTVYVYHGIYNQIPYSSACVKINKSITLCGEDKYTTILNGSYTHDVIRVVAGNVHISGFTIQKSGTGTVPGTGVHIYKSNGIGYIDNITVYDTIIINNTAGMTMVHCSNTTFFNNIFSGNGVGCYVSATLNSSLYYNLFIKNELGIKISVDNAIVIYQNEFMNNTIGINIFNSQGATIQKNNFFKNNVQATYEKEGSIWHFFTLFKYKQKWSSNYWDDWHETSPRPIKGSFVILVRILPIPLGIIGIPFPSYEYDRTPALTPYEIGG